MIVRITMQCIHIFAHVPPQHSAKFTPFATFYRELRRAVT